MSYGGGSGGSGKIATANDVALNNPANNDVLTYSSVTQKWTNAPAGGASGSGTADTYTLIFNVKNYGAIGDATADDTAAIQSAIAAANSRSIQGGIVYFPLGNYRVTSALSISAHIYLVGESPSVTQIFYNGATITGAFITFGQAGQISTNTGIRDMGVDAAGRADTCVKMYGPQEGSSLTRAQVFGGRVYGADIISSGIVGGSNKFTVQQCWIWTEGANGMAGIHFDSYAGPLAIRDTTFVGVNRGQGYTLPAGSAGIISDGGIFVIDNVNVEYFESHTYAKSSNINLNSPSNFFCTYGVTLESTDGGTIITNATFDNVTACLRNVSTSTMIGFFKNYRGEAYQYDRRSFDQNWWAYGSANVYGSDTSQTQTGYSVFNNADTSRYKISTIQSGSGWTEVANVDSSLTFGTAGSAYNAQHLRLGAYHMWIDASGRLRVKSSAPTTDTDGTVVGSQS